MAGDHTRIRILQAGGEVFAEKGYEPATVREICDRAGVNQAAVNYYFHSKEALYAEALQWAHSHDHQQLESPVWPPGMRPADKLRLFIHALLGRMLATEGEPWEARLLMRELLDSTPMGRRVLGDRFRHRIGQLELILDEILPADTPRHQRQQIGLSIMGQCLLYHGLAKIIPLIVGQEELEQHYGVEQLAEHIARMSLAALGIEPPLGHNVSGTIRVPMHQAATGGRARGGTRHAPDTASGTRRVPDTLTPDTRGPL